jgi:hypothetical protein
MRNRRIIDERFAADDATAAPAIESDSVAGLYAHLPAGRWSSVISHAWLHMFGVPEGMRVVALELRSRDMAKVLCVLYDDPADGYPTTYARDDLPAIDHHPGGQITPTPEAVDFTPGHLLGSVSGELGLRTFLEKAGHTLVVTSDKDGDGSVFDREPADADVVISQPF